MTEHERQYLDALDAHEHEQESEPEYIRRMALMQTQREN